ISSRNAIGLTWRNVFANSSDIAGANPSDTARLMSEVGLRGRHWFRNGLAGDVDVGYGFARTGFVGIGVGGGVTVRDLVGVRLSWDPIPRFTPNRRLPQYTATGALGRTVRMSVVLGSWPVAVLLPLAFIAGGGG